MMSVSLLFGIAVIVLVLFSSIARSRFVIPASHVEGHSTLERMERKSIVANSFEQMNEYKSMYHKLQNLEDFPKILPSAKALLLSLLDTSLSTARYRDLKRSILDIREFTPDALERFLRDERQDVLGDFELYAERRLAGSGPELFKSREEALDWLKRRAPLNLIDGAWLCRVHKITTPFFLRPVTRYAWQTLSEELGDGESKKNHVFIYRKLLRDSGIHLPDADSVDFIHPRHGIEDQRVWRSAVGQLLISLFSNEFLPELLGFNLHFESLTNSDLKAAGELPEFGLSGYYYTLHISIDNADSGHSAIALETIVRFMDAVKATGVLNYQKAWARIQAGYLLSQSLDGDLTASDYEDQVMEMLGRKAKLAKQMHCRSKTRIAGRSIADWFSLAIVINGFSGNDSRRQAFLAELAGSKPWVYQGKSHKSLLVKELMWKGKMFGAFTASETRLLSAWIDSLPSEDSEGTIYRKWVGEIETVEKAFSPPRHDTAVTHPVFPPQPRRPSLHRLTFRARPPLQRDVDFNLDALLKLWLVHPCLLENMVASPYQTITKLSSLALQLMRADMGHDTSQSDGVVGTDEHQCSDQGFDIVSIGLSVARKHGRQEPACLGDELDAPESNTNGTDAATFAYALLSWSIRPKQNQVFLLGLSRAFLDLQVWAAQHDDLLPKPERRFLQTIVNSKAGFFEACLDEVRDDEARISRTLTKVCAWAIKIQQYKDLKPADSVYTSIYCPAFNNPEEPHFEQGLLSRH